MSRMQAAAGRAAPSPQAAGRSVLEVEEHDGKLAKAERATPTVTCRTSHACRSNADGSLGFTSVPACSTPSRSLRCRRFAAVLRGLRPLATLTGSARAGFGVAALARNARARRRGDAQDLHDNHRRISNA